ncbi:MAG: hypothetical protein SFV81_09230 [Pirellulaceae bacterium]|nr:hypothetical protein [Pirellulaceae bacterium]
MRGYRNRNRNRLTAARREGAVLLDLFLATLIFSICVIAIGQFGSQSLQIAQKTTAERLAMLKAESILAKEVAFGPRKSPQMWKDSLQGVPLSIRVSWKETDQKRLQRVTVDVSANNDLRVGRNTISLSRLVFMSEDK